MKYRENYEKEDFYRKIYFKDKNEQIGHIKHH